MAPTKKWKTGSDPDLPYGNTSNPGGVFPSPEFHITVYVSPNDKALAASGRVLGSIARVGRIDLSTLPPEDIAHSRLLGSFNVLQVSGTSCFICHSYFVSNPRVSSDLIALLRYGLKPNELGRRYAHLAAGHRRLLRNACARCVPWKPKLTAQLRHSPEIERARIAASP